jgi:hypothetical protein
MPWVRNHPAKECTRWLSWDIVEYMTAFFGSALICGESIIFVAEWPDKSA